MSARQFRHRFRVAVQAVYSWWRVCFGAEVVDADEPVWGGVVMCAVGGRVFRRLG